jgi:hypothetical protein
MTAAVLTPTCQKPTDRAEMFTAAGLVAALEHCWAVIRTRHPEVPAAVIVVASGSPTKASDTLKWGHFASLRWQHGTHRLPEVLVSGEGLSRTPAEIFTTLLHEATHGLADVRNIQDTSRQGRWHNKRFATLAAELGMDTTRHDKFGYSPCTLRPTTASHYRSSIDRLAAALGAYRHPETVAIKQRASNNNGVTCECECPRKIRISLAVYEAGPIWCPECGEYFIRDDDVRDEYNHEHGTVTQPNQPATINERAEDDPMVFYDPTGATYGLPTYPYHGAPKGLATVRQLRKQGLRPGGQDIVAQIMWRKGKRVAHLYDITKAKPKRQATPAQRAAIDKALLARRTCPTCKQVKEGYIARRQGECFDCQYGDRP